MPTVDFWFDYTCPFAYIASTRVEALAARMNAQLNWQPMLLGGVLQANGAPADLSASLAASKAAQIEQDWRRWAELFGLPIKKPAGHPMKSVGALRATLACGCDPAVIRGFYRAYWVDGRQPSEVETIRQVVGAAGHDVTRVLAEIEQPAMKDELRRRTERAVELGIFGAPTIVTDDGALFWGQDRMHLVAGARMDALLPPLPTRRPGQRRRLEVYWDFSSPFAYLGVTQVETLAAHTGAEIVWRPMLLGGLFKTIGQVGAPLLSWSPAKQRYYLQDLERWAAHLDVPFAFPPGFPVNSLKAMRCYLALPEKQRRAFQDRTYRACWAEGRDISDDGVLRDLLGDAAAETLERSQTAPVKQELIQLTEQAAAAGVFGAPTWVIDGKEMFWGQDRLALVERALLG